MNLKGSVVVLETMDLYFEDIDVGTVFYSPRRTVTEADVVNFAGISGDYNPLHTDETYAKNTDFGKRVAHGLLGLSIASGLFTRTELSQRMQKSGIALLGIDWKFVGPLMIDDTIHLEIEIKDKRITSNPDRGVVTFLRKVVNQDNKTIQIGEVPMLVKTRIRLGMKGVSK